MEKIYPQKIAAGSHIRVIAPARSLQLISEEDRNRASERLAHLGLEISFGKNVLECDEFVSSLVSSRLEDLHDAYKDPSVDGILSVIGGYNSNQLLSHIDYELIRQNPKILCGFSDITALSNAIFAKTGVIGYSGAHFSTFGMKKGLDYTVNKFKACLFSETPYKIENADQWSDDLWFLDQENREFIDNEGFWRLNSKQGEFKGTSLGGHLRCLNALQGSEFMPSLKNAILLIEEDAEIPPQLFDRQLQSILHLPEASDISAILIGRFQKGSHMTRKILQDMINAKPELKDIAVIANCDFGHTTPIATFPIGGDVSVKIEKDNVEITVEKH